MSDESDFRLRSPDWSSIDVRSRAQSGVTSPLGDATRWGAQVQREIPAPVAAVEIHDSGQVLRVQASDGYPRSWSILGTVRLPAVTWAAPIADFGVVLEVMQGVGQATIVQEINLRLLCDIGLAVYSPTNHAGGMEERAFAGIGSLIGNAISGRVRYGARLGVPGLPATVHTNVILTPYAAGTGL